MDKDVPKAAPFWQEEGEITISKSEYNLLKALAEKELGRFVDEFKRNKPVKRGAPPKHKYGNVDCQRAFQIWWLANNIKKALGKPLHNGSIKTRDLIHLAWKLRSKLPDFEKLFPIGTGQLETLEQSISRGRKILMIDDRWHSTTCEEIAIS